MRRSLLAASTILASTLILGACLEDSPTIVESPPPDIPLAPAYAVVTAQNGLIAFDSNRDGDEEIFVMNADGSGQTQLTFNTGNDHNPVWSPDGAKIAFNSDRTGPDIWVMNADGSGATNLTNGPKNDGGPSWSPDGARIAYASNSEIFVMNADGSGQTNLTNDAAADYSASWSPDGTTIAFQSDRAGRFDIYVMNTDGTGVTNLSNSPGSNEHSPDWSPDGTRIVFGSDRDDAAYAEIYVMNADGTGQTRLTNTVRLEDGPSWSPDGTKIIFRRQRRSGSNSEIHVINADGSGDTNLTNHPAEDLRADWGPVPNSPPDLSTDTDPVEVNEGAPAGNTGAVSDSDDDAVVLSASVGSVTNNNDGTWSWSFSTTDGPAESQTVTINADDGNGGTAQTTFTLTVNNVAPAVDAGPDKIIDESSLFSRGGSFADPGADTWSATVDYGKGAGKQPLALAGMTFSLSQVYADDGVYTVTVEVTDKDDVVGSDQVTVTVNNVAPSVGAVTVPLDPIDINDMPVTGVSAPYTDPGTADTHTCAVDYDDGSLPQAGTATNGTCTGPGHIYTEAGVYTVTVEVTDDDGGVGSSTAETMIVIYDPSGGFVTGGGWFNSPAGAFKADELLTGRANFGFVSKYKKGANVPTGNTEFRFKAGDLNFHSTSYDWLVVNQNGENAQFRGEGTMNGTGVYRFMLWAGDKDPDTFRIKITEVGGGIVYDNGFDQPIGGGSIVIHTKK